MSKVVDKSYSKLRRLLDDAESQVQGVVESSDQNKETLLVALKLLKLHTAQQRSTEAISDATQLLYSEYINEYYNRTSQSIDTLGDILADDYMTYNKILKILYPEKESTN